MCHKLLPELLVTFIGSQCHIHEIISKILRVAFTSLFSLIGEPLTWVMW